MFPVGFHKFWCEQTYFAQEIRKYGDQENNSGSKGDGCDRSYIGAQVNGIFHFTAYHVGAQEMDRQGYDKVIPEKYTGNKKNRSIDHSAPGISFLFVVQSWFD